MAIYGHMNKKLPDDDQDPPPEMKDEIPLEAEVNETISSFLQEAEDAVKSTQQEITLDTNKMDLEGTTHSTTTPTQEADEHFTITNSPTRFQHNKDTTTKE